MRVARNRRRAVFSWLFISLVAGLSLILGVLQYRWIGESAAPIRTHARGLQSASAPLDFNSELTAARRIAPHPYSLESPAMRRRRTPLPSGAFRAFKGFFRESPLPPPGNLTFLLLDLDKGVSRMLRGRHLASLEADLDEPLPAPAPTLPSSLLLEIPALSS
ncbi:MAG: hypothetical protein LC126_06190 [Bryobacterales bacterium]|nr:hypothetical protein [Bryobacterales bacterium]